MKHNRGRFTIQLLPLQVLTLHTQWPLAFSQLKTQCKASLVLSSEMEQLSTKTTMMDLSSTKSSPLRSSLLLRGNKLPLVSIKNLTMSTILIPFSTVLLIYPAKQSTMLQVLRPTQLWEMDQEELNISMAPLLASIITTPLLILKCLLSQFTMSSIKFQEAMEAASLITPQLTAQEEISLHLFLSMPHQWWSLVQLNTQMCS